jgi:hypothetical protein
MPMKAVFSDEDTYFNKIIQTSKVFCFLNMFKLLVFTKLFMLSKLLKILPHISLNQTLNSVPISEIVSNLMCVIQTNVYCEQIVFGKY